ncbi:MAG TPA: Mu-like prophage major head subunit gpT family protein [Polyangiaceae bacterium]|nr:Mu-like prophage major head subunit gpT family protein [Polyangiaceae bacterium]
MPVTPEFLTDLETNMRSITVDQYKRLTRDTWWNKIAKVVPIKSKKERIHWLLETAQIERPNASHGGGQQIFEDMVSLHTEFEAENAVAALTLKKEQMEDLENGIVGGEAMRLAASWSRQVASHAAYWPQQEVGKALIANPIGYDGQNFFDVDHPYNPYNTGAGTYRNVFTGSASGIYPGALKIDSSVTVDVAVQNIAKALAYVASLKMPNGVLPRKLKLAHIFVPPALTARAQQVTNAKFIAQAASSGGGSGDVEAVIRNFGLGQPVQIDEIGSAFGGSDTSWYLGMEDITNDELGAFVYVDREPFSVNYHGPQTSAELARKRTFEWTLEGRNTVAPGHPFLLFRCDAA